MAEKILYYLGAGASAKEFPLARTRWSSEPTDFSIGIPQIKGLAYELEELARNFPDANFKNNLDDIELIQKSVQDLLEISKMANVYGDVDTYAKYLHLTRPLGNKLEQLKQTISLYFIIRQLLEKKLDSRYVPWLVGIMNNQTFPDNIKILSWNYDFQVELAMQKIGFLGELGYLPSTSRLRESPSLIHMNGIAGHITDYGFNRSSNVFNTLTNDISNIIKDFLKLHNVEYSFHFAWEKGKYHEDLMFDVRKMVADTTILVVIGYSFPFFNREIDKQVFDVLKNGKVKIYYQDPILNGNQLISQFNLSKADYTDIVHIQQTENFHIPFEY